MHKKVWVFDIDGVITANPQVLSWLSYHLTKNENNNRVYLLSWRDGSDEARREQTYRELESFNIIYDELILAPKRFTSTKQAAYWKIAKLRELKADIWFDDEIKIYQRDYGINLDKLLPDVIKVHI